MAEEEKRMQDASKWRPFLETYAKRIRSVDVCVRVCGCVYEDDSHHAGDPFCAAVCP